jgi:integrase
VLAVEGWICVGISDLHFHDLRGTFVTRRLSEGWTPVEVASCTGHSMRDLGMLDLYSDRRQIATALAARINKEARNGE